MQPTILRATGGVAPFWLPIENIALPGGGAVIGTALEIGRRSRVGWVLMFTNADGQPTYG